MTNVVKRTYRAKTTTYQHDSQGSDVSAVFEDVEDRVIDVKAHGAVGDGVTDDTTSLQAALDDANSAGGGDVFLPAGDYVISAPLKIYSGTTFRGSNPVLSSENSRLLLADNSNINMIEHGNAAAMTDGRQILIEDIYFFGNKGEQTSNGSAIYWEYVVESMIRKCVFDFIESHAIYLGSNTQTISVIHNWGQSIDGDGIRLVNSPDNYIANNQITANTSTGDGLSLEGSSNGNVVMGNFFFLCGQRGIRSEGNRNSFIGNRLNTNGRDGMLCLGDDNTVLGNVCYDNGSSGSGVPAGLTFEGDDNTVIGNRCWDTGTGDQDFGIATRNDPARCVFIGNSLEGNVVRGMDNTTAVYNIFRDNPTGTTAYEDLSDQDATPSVVHQANFYRTANTLATTITDFDDGVPGQEIFVIINDASTTIDFTASGLKGNAGVDWSPTTGDHMRCKYDGTDWYCEISDNTA